MNQSEYDRLSQNIEQARQIIGTERAMHMTRAYDLMESGLTLLGVTAVEDRLQEDVQETLECLRIAGIKVSFYYTIFIYKSLIHYYLMFKSHINFVN